MTFNQILDRDVPTIKSHTQEWARQGVCAPVAVFYKHEAIAGQSTACNHNMEADGWIPAGFEIPNNIPYEAYWRFLSNRLQSTPIFA